MFIGNNITNINIKKDINNLYKLTSKTIFLANSDIKIAILKDGENKFDFIVKDKNNVEKQRLTRVIVSSGYPVRAELIEEYSRLVADGTYSPVIALRLYDKNDHPVRPGSQVEFEINCTAPDSVPPIPVLDEPEPSGL